MVILPLGLAASLSRSRSCCAACCAFFSLFSSALLLACAHDQQESAPAVSRIASVFLIVPASCTRSCTSRICVGCDGLLEGGLPKVGHEGCWPELPGRVARRQQFRNNSRHTYATRPPRFDLGCRRSAGGDRYFSSGAAPRRGHQCGVAGGGSVVLL